VLVRLRKSEDRSAGGLFLPAGAKDAVAEALFAEVVEVARATDDPEPDGFGANVSGVPLGAFVLFPKNEGTPVPWDEELRLLEVKHVLATVEEIHLEQAH
jgi:co-chaperonin GroES (HSP10)